MRVVSGEPAMVELLRSSVGDGTERKGIRLVLK